MSGAFIQLRGLRKQFTAHNTVVDVLDGVDLDVQRGEFVALLGPSGCGKSTVLNIVAGLVEASGGEALYDGLPVNGPNTRAGYMTQRDTLLPWRSVRDNVGMPLELAVRRTGREEREQRVRDLINMVNLTGFEKHYPAELSGGMRKRTALARTLIYEPETLLMDEPFGALDAQLKLVMQGELLRIWDRLRQTVLFVTHDPEEAIALADRVVVFSARPARIRIVREIPIPRPRDVVQLRLTPAFAAVYEEIWDALSREIETKEAAVGG